MDPVYIETFKSGLLQGKITKAQKILKSCTLCPRHCKIDRYSMERGICKTGIYAQVSGYQPHFGEEHVLVGSGGSGTIFFTNCNLPCNFCQNYDISHLRYGEEMTEEQVSNLMLLLQNKGCHNINFVTPSHVVPQILTALNLAIKKGLNIPLVYNTGSYDKVSTLKLLDGVIDIFMPDFKFMDKAKSELTMNAPDYPDIAKNAIKEMFRQVGDLVIDGDGIAARGLLVRHLVMPGDLDGTRQILKFIAREISLNTYVNIMPQYRPEGRARDIKQFSFPLSGLEYENALKIAREEGIFRLDKPWYWREY